MENNYSNESDPNLQKRKPKFKIGDRVRIFKYENKFEKGFVGYWTKEIFEVCKINQTYPITYEIEDLDDQEITGRFYQNDFQISEL